jgi:serine/threonine protein kinase
LKVSGRLAREAQLASSLNHSNIVTVYDVGEEAGHAKQRKP